MTHDDAKAGPPRSALAWGSDLALHLFMRPAFLSITIGIPFCIFKLLFSLSVFRAEASGHGIIAGAGLYLHLWAGADLAMNTGRVIFNLAGKTAPFDYCLISQIGRWLHHPGAFLAVDTLITFSILCTMLWSGFITMLNPIETVLWYSATTLNLISLTIVSLYREIRHI